MTYDWRHGEDQGEYFARKSRERINLVGLERARSEALADVASMMAKWPLHLQRLVVGRGVEPSSPPAIVVYVKAGTRPQFDFHLPIPGWYGQSHGLILREEGEDG